MKTSSSTIIRRILISAGFVVGFGVLAVGTANADEDRSPGLLGGLSQVVTPVTDQLAPVTDGVSQVLSPVTDQLAPVTSGVSQVLSPVTDQLAPAVSGVTAVAEPVLKPVTAAVRPLTEPLRPVIGLVAPTVTTVTDVVAPVLEPLAPVTAPLLAPVVQVTEKALSVATPVLAPVTEPLARQAATPVAPAGTVVPTAVAPESVAAESVAAESVVPAAVPVVPVALVWASTPTPSKKIAAPAWNAPSSGLRATAPAAPWYQGDVPALPRDVPLVVQGTTSSASAGGLNAPASAVVPGTPRTSPNEGAVKAAADGPARGSWFYDYGLSHPS